MSASVPSLKVLLFHDCFADFQIEIGKQNDLKLYPPVDFQFSFLMKIDKNVEFCEANYHGMMTDLYKKCFIKK